MAMKRICWLCFLILAVAFPAKTYEIPETLHYRLVWMGIRVGTSSLETHRVGSVVEIISSARSAAWTAPFYRVDNRETSSLHETSAGPAQGRYHKQLHEGPLRVSRTIEIDRANGRIHHADLRGGKMSEVDYSGEAWDPVASMFVVRNRPLSPGETIRLNLLDDNLPNEVEIRVLRREVVETPAGIFPALVVKVGSNLDAEGLFYAQGDLTVWLSDDAAHRPLRIDKRIPGLFALGLPRWLRPLVPEAMLHSPRLETVRAELVGM